MKELIDFLEKKGLKVEANGLRNRGTLLNLYNKNIGAEGVKFIAEVIRSNHSLTQLNLSYNNIGAEGTKFIAEALKSNHSLTQLNLGINNIGTEGVKLIAEALKSNHSLTQLNLSYNNIGVEGTKFIAEVLKSNHYLTLITLDYNLLNCAASITINEYLQRNKMMTANAKKEYEKQQLKKIIVNLQDSTDINKADKNIIDKICDKAQKLTDIHDIKNMTQSLREFTAGKITKGKILDLDEEIDEMIEKQAKREENERKEKLNIFNQTVSKLITQLETANIKDGVIIQNQIKEIATRVSTMKNSSDILHMTTNVTNIVNSNKITKGKFIDLKEEVDGLIAQQPNQAVNIYKENAEKNNEEQLKLEAKRQAELVKKQRAEQQVKQQAELQAKQQQELEVKRAELIKQTEQKAINLSNEGNILFNKGAYDQAIEKYSEAFKITGNNLYKEYRESTEYYKNQHILELEAKQQAELAKKQKAEQQAKQQAELQAKQQATIKEEVKLPSSIKNTTSTAPSPKKTHEQEATQELVIYKENIKEKIEKIKNTASQTMHQKIKIIETKIAMVTTKNSIEKILDEMDKIINENRVTNGRLSDLEENVDKILESQKHSVRKVLIKPATFQKVLLELEAKIKNDNTIILKDKPIMQAYLDTVRDKVLKLQDKSSLGQITENMKNILSQDKITKGMLEDLVDEIKQITANSVTDSNIKVNMINEIVYNNPLLNHPKLLQAASENKLSPNLIYDAINNNDEELILAGLISVGYDGILIK